MAKITNTEAPCWVIVRPDGQWHGVFVNEQQAQDFYDWKKAAKDAPKNR